MSERKLPARRADYAVFESIATRWMDVDVYGHLNNVIHYSLFDTAVNGWLIRQGLLDPLNSPQIGLVVETGCRYHAEILFPDVVAAGIRVESIGTSSVRYGIGLFRNDEDQAAAQGFFVHVHVDAQTRRPVAVPPALRHALEGILRVAN